MKLHELETFKNFLPIYLSIRNIHSLPQVTLYTLRLASFYYIYTNHMLPAPVETAEPHPALFFPRLWTPGSGYYSVRSLTPVRQPNTRWPAQGWIHPFPPPGGPGALQGYFGRAVSLAAGWSIMTGTFQGIDDVEQADQNEAECKDRQASTPIRHVARMRPVLKGTAEQGQREMEPLTAPSLFQVKEE